MALLATAFILLNSIVIGSIGAAYLYDPNILLARYGLAVDSPGLDNMLRSTYGGLFIAMAGTFALGAFGKTRRSDILTLVALFMGGLAVGRIASLIMAGAPDPAIYTLLGYETAACAIALFLRRGNASV